MTSLSHLISADTVRTHVTAKSWQEAIQAAGELLQHSGASGESYTQKMIDNVAQNGPYIVIAPGFAFAHARADESVTRTAMSVVRLESPVEFGHSKNDPVQLVLALAAQDATAHQTALSQLAKMLADPRQRARIDSATTDEELLSAFQRDEVETAPGPQQTATTPEQQLGGTAHDSSHNKNFILTVCGNGLGTSLFLKNTLEQVLDHWGWSPYLRVEATDTISARGRANEADFILTSGEIAKTLGEVDIPVKVIEDFTSQREIDAALRDLYDV